MKREQGNWVGYLKQLNLSATDEIDLHFEKRDRHAASYEVMADVAERVRRALRDAQETTLSEAPTQLSRKNLFNRFDAAWAVPVKSGLVIFFGKSESVAVGKTQKRRRLPFVDD
jgi:hypothetical protein